MAVTLALALGWVASAAAKPGGSHGPAGAHGAAGSHPAVNASMVARSIAVAHAAGHKIA
jgi:hypothetical protein